MDETPERADLCLDAVLPDQTETCVLATFADGPSPLVLTARRTTEIEYELGFRYLLSCPQHEFGLLSDKAAPDIEQNTEATLSDSECQTIGQA
jgi:hypothetical protein